MTRSTTIYPNNCEYSHIRTWLNGQFATTSFNAEESARIQTTVVDNSLVSTGDVSNPYVGNNTNDKVFLLSNAEAANPAYGMGTDASRQLTYTPYAKAQGAFPYGAIGMWWLRTPETINSAFARNATDSGFVSSNNVRGTYNGIVPAMWISL